MLFFFLSCFFLFCLFFLFKSRDISTCPDRVRVYLCFCEQQNIQMVMNKDNIVQTSRANLLPPAHTEIPIIIIQPEPQTGRNDFTNSDNVAAGMSSNMKTMLGGPASVSGTLSEYNQLSEV